MTAHDQVLPSENLAAGASPTPLSNWVKSIVLRLTAWAGNCADYYAAAAMYQQLSGLSDAELARRGLSRATLAHDVRAAHAIAVCSHSANGTNLHPLSDCGRKQ